MGLEYSFERLSDEELALRDAVRRFNQAARSRTTRTNTVSKLMEEIAQHAKSLESEITKQLAARGA